MISWSSSVGEPWVAGSIPASTSARVALEPQALPVTRRAHGDVAPLPRAGSIHPGIAPVIVSLAQQVERGGRRAALVAGSSPARDAGLWCCEFFEPYNSSELSASAERHSGTPIRPWRIGTARNEERAKKLVTGRERPAISLRSSMVEHHRRRTARGAFDGLPCLRGPDHSALTARGARLVDGGDARSIRAGGAVDKTQTEPLGLEKDS